jgi:hypothetical protein
MNRIPVPFSKDSVLAILVDRKFATRRMSNKYAKVKKGDVLIGREALVRSRICSLGKEETIENWTVYEADMWPTGHGLWTWQRPRLPSIFMPLSLSRFSLEVTRDAYRQPVEEMTKADAIKEGMTGGEFFDWPGSLIPSRHVREYAQLWDRLNGKTNPFITNPSPWVIEFKRLAEIEIEVARGT